MAKMAGPFIPLPKEVIDLLSQEKGKSLQYYVIMLSECYLQTVEDTDTEWVGARINNSQRDIMSKIGGGSNVRLTVFPRWEELGLVERVDGGFYLTRYYRKGDAYIQPLKMQKEIGELRQAHGETKNRQIEMEKTIQHLLDLLSNRREVISAPRASQRRDSRLPEARSAPPRGAATSLLSHRSKKITLSVMNKVISIFYAGIGKSRISSVERNASQKGFRSLQKDGFSAYEIAFAVDWTIKPGRVTEKMRSFGIISSTIGEAVEQLNKLEEKADREEVAAQNEVSDAERRENEAAEKELMLSTKDAMPQEDRAALRDQALEALREMGVYNEDMITDILIGIQENQILRERSGSSTDNEEPERQIDVSEVES